MTRDGIRGDPYGVPPPDRGRGRSRSPDPGFSTRSVVEIAELQDKLEKTSTELRRAQAELRLNQSDYDRSHVELEQMQEKVRTRLFVDHEPGNGHEPTFFRVALSW